MCAWTSITKPTVGDSIKKSLIDDVIDDLDYLFDNLEAGVLIENGSFENGDSPNDPTGWTSTKWGTGDIETTDPGHGAQGYKFTSSGSGGGYLTMEDFGECSEYGYFAVSWYMKSSVADVKNIVRVLWYKKDQTACSSASTDLYNDSTANPTTWQLLRGGCTPPADARFFKIRLIGCDSSDATTGSTIFDGVSVETYDYPDVSAGSDVYVTLGTERTSTSTSYEKKKEVTMRRAGTFTISFKLKSLSGAPTVYGRIYRNGVAVGSEWSTSDTNYVTCSEDISGWEHGDNVQLYVKVSGGGLTAYVDDMVVGFQDPTIGVVVTS